MKQPAEMEKQGMSTREQRKHNLRLGLILASVVMALFFGIMVRWALMGG